MTKTKKYQVSSTFNGETVWEPCKKAVVQSSGWLHYELEDGTNGLARPGRWQEKVKKEVQA
jgi:hypothetical protein